MSWFYNGIEVDESSDGLEGSLAFVYKITNLADNRMYIGKKLLRVRKTKQVKGKKKKFLVQSNWLKYWGSNKPLQEDVLRLGETNFKREIIKMCKSKGEANYWEAKLQFENDVLLTTDWYNDHIMVRVHRSHVANLYK